VTEAWRELERRVRRLEVGVAILIVLGIAPTVGIDPRAPATAAAQKVAASVR